MIAVVANGDDMSWLRKQAAAAVFSSFKIFMAPNAFATECVHAEPSLSGHYFMSGVMEVGSELLLQANGRFEYMLAYGALDEYASGCWSTNGRTVTLAASKFQTNAKDPMKFRQLELEIRPGGKLVRTLDDGHTGIYSR
jgi:hypothetical protein